MSGRYRFDEVREGLRRLEIKFFNRIGTSIFSSLAEERSKNWGLQGVNPVEKVIKNFLQTERNLSLSNNNLFVGIIIFNSLITFLNNE